MENAIVNESQIVETMKQTLTRLAETNCNGYKDELLVQSLVNRYFPDLKVRVTCGLVYLLDMGIGTPVSLNEFVSNMIQVFKQKGLW